MNLKAHICYIFIDDLIPDRESFIRLQISLFIYPLQQINEKGTTGKYILGFELQVRT